MNKERRVGRRSVVHNLVKLTPENENDRKGPKKALFEKNIEDDSTFAMSRRRLNPLHEIINFQSSTKSKSQENLHTEGILGSSSSANNNLNYMDVFNHYNKIPLSPPNRTGLLEASMVKNRKECEIHRPILQSEELFNTLIDSPCTKYGKVQFNNALSSASKYLLSRHLESVEKNADEFCETPTNINLPLPTQIKTDEFKTPYLIDLNDTPKQVIPQLENETVTQSIEDLIEDIEKLKKDQLENVNKSKSECFNMLKSRLKEIELEIENHFRTVEKNITENHDKIINMIKDKKKNSVTSKSTGVDAVKEETVVKEKNYTRMTGAFGILNNLNKDCSFLKTPKTKGKTREEMLNKGILTPGTMSFVVQEQLMSLDNSL
ncbi:uncharacterized protein LOC126843624 isoform X2 [Adelges cooleyi]|uniref:uncharacterized protein LOC126843624 isoform X2 n=1 Tax=Adelges cooleyi TaxID=133065 RepID=UPI00217F81E5|nr:uncharacterized protein LOC126843624 isoform X2 [Adelges cooleyi]